MSAKKATATSKRPTVPAPVGRLTRWLVGPGRKTTLALAMLAALGFGWWSLWQHVRERVLTTDDYRLSLDRIEITPLPPWIQSDIKRRVVEDASLDGSVSVLDADLAPRLQKAFLLHPWVSRVESVSVKFPATIVAQLVYREPVAMVDTTDGLAPIDKEGFVLPKDDFSPSEARTYPKLVNIRTPLRSAEGARWGDLDVANGAKIARLLRPHWQKLKLDHIAAPRESVHGRDDFELFTHAGTQVIWGSPPGSEQPGEMTAEAKLARLVAFAASHGSLDGDARETIDLRGSHEQFFPRTAAKPQSPPEGAAQ